MAPNRNVSAPAKDHTGEPLFHPNAHPAPALDLEPAREYKNDGNGLSNVSGQNYNEAHGRDANAPTSGGPRKSSKSLGSYGGWSADRPIKASSVKSRGSDPID